MEKNKSSRFTSIAVKNSIVYLLLILLSSVMIGAAIFQLGSKSILSTSTEQLNHNTGLIKDKFESFLAQIEQDILLLSENPLLLDFVYKDDDSYKQKLSTSFLNIIQRRVDYSQLRYIAIQPYGLELIRVDRQGDTCFVVADSALQNKGGRDYFVESLYLEPGEVYFSVIDLNKEHGNISKPHIPTLRVSCLVRKNGRAHGVLVVNADLRRFFQKLEEYTGPEFDCYVFNQDGHFLIHPNRSLEFGFEFSKPPYVFSFLGLEEQTLSESSLFEIKRFSYKDDEKLIKISKIKYPKKRYNVYISMGVSEHKILRPFYQWQWKTVLIILSLTALFLILAFIWAKRQSNQLTHIIRSMISFSESYATRKLPVTRNDEIGLMARTFKNLTTTISQNVKDLESAKKEAETANRDKEIFLENMSHELRTPLHAITGMIGMLKENAKDDSLKPIVESLLFSSNQLTSISNDILDFAKLRHGNITLNFKPVNLQDLLRNIEKTHRFEVVKKQIDLQLLFDGVDPKLAVKADPIRLGQIIHNLISNAIKFTPSKGNIFISLITIQEDNKSILIRFSVKDNGKGISEEDQAKIFERYKTDQHPQMKGIGTGLGLPIIIELLELFESSLHLESTSGSGSNFFFDLCFTKSGSDNIDSSLRGSEDTFIILKDKKMLCIDDDRQSLFLYQSIFEKYGSKVICVQSINELQTLRGNKFDIVISDFILASQHIKDHLELINASKKPKSVCIGVSGKGFEDISWNTSIFNEVLIKPVPARELIRSVTYELASLEFGKPNFSGIENDYDHDSKLIKKALKILVKEWEQMKESLLSSFKQDNKKQFHEVYHKMITTLRYYNLHPLIEVLDDMRHSNGRKIDHDTQQKIAMMLDHYDSSFRKKLNSYSHH